MDSFAIASLAHRAGSDCARGVSCGASRLYTLHDLAYLAIVPAAVLLVLAWALLRKSSAAGLAVLIRDGAVAGPLATVALEAVRYSGFRMEFMPGNLPELMGVLLLDRFALGPTAASTLVGFAYHFWNGACFGIIFALGRFNLPVWCAVPYGAALGVGFLISPVVQGLGVGIFGVKFGWHFAATVLTAHLAFGTAMAVMLRRNQGCKTESPMMPPAVVVR